MVQTEGLVLPVPGFVPLLNKTLKPMTCVQWVHTEDLVLPDLGFIAACKP